MADFGYRRRGFGPILWSVRHVFRTLLFSVLFGLGLASAHAGSAAAAYNDIRGLSCAGLPQLVGIFGCRDSRFACKSRGEVTAGSEIL
jgi:hypothetical protein